MEILNISLGATEFKQFRKAGSYIEILSSSGTVTINMYSGLGAQTNTIQGGVSGLFLNADFGAFDIQNTSGVAQTVQLLTCGAHELGGSRRQPGNVTIIDGSYYKTLSGNQFISGIARSANAAGSALLGWQGQNGKAMAVRGMMLFSSIAGAVLIGNGTGGGTLAGVLSTQGQSKIVNGTLSNAKSIQADSAAITPTTGEVTGYVGTMRMQLQAGVPFVYQFQNPIVINGTNNLTVSGQALNRDLSMILEWEEN